MLLYAGKIMKRPCQIIAVVFLLTIGTPVFAAEEVNSGVAPLETIESTSQDTNNSYALDIVLSEDQVEPIVDSMTSFDLLPDIYKVSINMLDQGGQDKLKGLASGIGTLLSEGKEYDAARMLGTSFGKERKNSISYLGFYCKRALPFIKGGLEAEAKFLSGFLSGYGKSGILMLTNEGIETIRVFGLKLGTQWSVVADGSTPKSKFDRIYKGRNTVFIPFSVGEIFKVHIYGAPSGTAKIWKILPNGTNTKSWKGGAWEREVTIRGDKLY